jgi:ornithine cyclodeaminase
VLVLSGAQIRDLLDLDALIDALATAMADLSGRRASAPDRIAAEVGEVGGLLVVMPGYVPARGALMTKMVSLFAGNAGTEVPTHQAVIVVFDPQTGSPTALLDGTEITDARTGGCSALSARLLAREDASRLAILGTGVQARSHARAMVRVRPIRSVVVAGRSAEKARALADELADELSGVEVSAVETFEEAVRGAAIVCATTHADAPVVSREWLAPGTHVTSVGYNTAGREIDDATVADAYVCVESRAAALAPAPAGTNDLLQPIADGVIGPDHVRAEIGELVAGTVAPPACGDRITLYKSVGVAVQDAAAAALVLGAARAAGVGRDVEL